MIVSANYKYGMRGIVAIGIGMSLGRIWEELAEEERHVLCALYRIVDHRVGRKPHHTPIGEIMRKLAPSLRDTATIRRALKGLKKRGLARTVKSGGEKESWTLTQEGANLAAEYCPRLWED